MERLISYFLERYGSHRTFAKQMASTSLGNVGSAAANAQEDDTTSPFTHITPRLSTIQKFTAALGKIAPLLEKHGGWKIKPLGATLAVVLPLDQERGSWRL